MNLDVYSGTWDILELDDSKGVGRPFHLFINNNVKQIPVPRFFYRMIINRAEDSGVVFIGINNPYLTLEQIKRDYIICKDVSDEIKYIGWKRENIQRGYCYACSVNDFVNVVPHHQVSASNLLVKKEKTCDAFFFIIRTFFFVREKVDITVNILRETHKRIVELINKHKQ